MTGPIAVSRPCILSRRGLLGTVVLSLALSVVRPADAAEKDEDAEEPDDDTDGKGQSGKGAKAAEDDDETLAQKAAQRFPQPVAVGALLNRKVLQPLESQPVLGTVKAIVRAKDESLEAVVDYGGFLGVGGRLLAVPIDAMALLSPELEIVDFEPAELDRFPTFDASGATPLKPNEIIRVGLAKPSH